jgi:hypothetical protein
LAKRVHLVSSSVGGALLALAVGSMTPEPVSAAAITSTTSTSFAGYQSSPPGGFSELTTSFHVPAVRCNPNSNEVFAVKTGLWANRLAHSVYAFVLEQCLGGAEYYGTLQVGAHSKSFPVNAGLLVNLEIKTTPTSAEAVLSAKGLAERESSATVPGTLTTFQVGSEPLHEVEPQNVQLPPPPFGAVNFTSVDVDGRPLVSVADLRETTWVNGPDLVIQPGPAANGAFTDTYKGP